MNMRDARWAGMLLGRAARMSLAANDRVFSRFGLTYKSWLALSKIADNPGMSAHELAELCLDTDQSFGQIAAKLAKMRLITRTPTYGRALLHAITEKGSEVLETADPLIDGNMAELFSSLSVREVTQLGKTLQKVILDQGDEPVRNSVLELAKIRKNAKKR